MQPLANQSKVPAVAVVPTSGTAYSATTAPAVGTYGVPVTSATAPVPAPVGYTLPQVVKQSGESGFPPSNEQLTGVLQHTGQLLEMQRGNVQTREGQQIITDAERTLESAQMLINERNRSQEVQEMIWHSKEAARELKEHEGLREAASGVKENVRGTVPLDKDRARQKLQSARNLVMLMLRSSEFRDAAMELSSLLQTLLQVGPEAIKEKRAQGELGKSVTQEEGVVLHTTVTVQQPAVTTGALPAFSSGFSGIPTATFIPSGAAPADVIVTTEAMSAKEASLSSGSQHTDHLRREARAKLRRVLQLLARNPQYQQGVRNFFRLFKQARTLYYDTKDTAKPAKGVLKNEHLVAAWYEARVLLQEFTGGRSVQPFFDNAFEMVRLIVKDAALRQYFKDVRDYIYEGFDNPIIFDDDARMKALAKRGRVLFKNIQLHDYTQRTLEEGRFIITAIRNDPVATRFASDLNRLMHDVFLDPNGTPTLKTEALAALKDIFIGMFMDELKYIPVPRIAGSNESMEYAIDSMNLTLFDLLPEEVEFKQKGKMVMHPVHIGTTKSNVSENTAHFVVKIHKRTIKIDNIHYAFSRLKTPRISDRGIANLEIRDGIHIKLYVTAQFGAKYSRYFQVTNVVARCGKVKLRIVDSRHKGLLRLAKPIITGQMRKKFVTGVQDGVYEQVGLLESRMQRLIENLGMRTGRPDLVQKLAMPMQKFVPTTANAPAVSASSAAAPASGPRPAY